MPHPRTNAHYSFEGGETSAALSRRVDDELFITTAKRMRNVRITKAGGFKLRPGLARVASLGGTARLYRFVARDGTVRNLVFLDDVLKVYKTDETLEATLSGNIWATADLATMQISQYNDTIYLASQAFWPQQIVWANGAFTVSDLAFYTRPDGSKAQPYYRFNNTKSIAITPSAVSGAGINITADASLFAAGYASGSVRFEFNSREIKFSSYVNTTSGKGDVINTLYPTRKLTLGSTTGYTQGDQCTTSVDSVDGEVSYVIDATNLDFLLTEGFTDPGTASNNLTGPNANSNITAVAAGTIRGSTIWLEQMISSVRGYPGGTVVHKQRLTFYDFPQAPEKHALSVIDTPDDFSLGAQEDDDAIIEGPGSITGKRIRHCLSAEQLLSFSEAGSYYVGEGPNTPLTPTTVEFLLIGPEPIGACNPILAAEGAVYIDANDRWLFLAPTGQLRRVWGSSELAAHSNDLLSTPVRLVQVDGCDWGPERYLIAVNSDGTLVVLHYPRGEAKPYGACVWSTTGGTFVDVCLMGTSVWCVVNRSGTYSLERFDPDRLLDNSVVFANVSPATPTNAAFVSRSNVALVWRVTASGEERRVDLGTLYTGTAGGVLTGAPTASRTYEGGTRIVPEVTLHSPIVADDGINELMRISEAAVDILNSGLFYGDGKAFNPYRTVDDLAQPPPLRTGWRKKKWLKRARDAEYSVTQTEAAPLEVRAITLKVR